MLLSWNAECLHWRLLQRRNRKLLVSRQVNVASLLANDRTKELLLQVSNSEEEGISTDMVTIHEQQVHFLEEQNLLQVSLQAVLEQRVYCTIFLLNLLPSASDHQL